MAAQCNNCPLLNICHDFCFVVFPQSVLTPGSVVSLPEVSRWQHSKEGVSVMKYSPDGSMLAVGTKDCPIDLCVCSMAGFVQWRLRNIKISIAGIAGVGTKFPGRLDPDTDVCHSFRRRTHFAVD